MCTLKRSRTEVTGKTEGTWQWSSISTRPIVLHIERQKTQISTILSSVLLLIGDRAFVFPAEAPETGSSCELHAFPCTHATRCNQDALNLFHLLGTGQSTCPVCGNPSDISPSYSAQQPCTIAAADCHGSSNSGISSEISSVAEDTPDILLQIKDRAKDPPKEQKAPQPRLQQRLIGLAGRFMSTFPKENNYKSQCCSPLQ